MTGKFVPPSIQETAFSCPHCGAYTSQHWFQLHAKKKDNTPNIETQGLENSLKKDKEIGEETRENLLAWCKNINTGKVFLENNSNAPYTLLTYNLHLSQCYNCNKIAVWIHDKLLFPPEKAGPSPNLDIPEDIIGDYEEARSILNLSPRGAAALLRLAIQKLCVHLGEKGKKIDDDIANLVSKGLNPLVQKSLDIVRVIGNEAVHPGTINLNDDRDTAEELFGLINLIAEQMISTPKHVDEMYECLPEEKRKAIEARDKKAKGK